MLQTLTRGVLAGVVLASGSWVQVARQTAPPASPAKSALSVEIIDDESQRSVPARAYLVDSRGAPWRPAGVPTYDKGAEHHFISKGLFSVRLPAGRYTLTIERGTEYLPSTQALEIAPGARSNNRVAARLKRWINMNRLGWYSADLHNHRSAQEMPELLLAEDLNLAPTLSYWVWEDRPISESPRTTGAVRRVDANHIYSVLDEEIERLRGGPGAVDLLGIRSAIPFRGYLLAPTNERFCRAVHQQRGYVDAEKIVWRDSAALVALGDVDFAGIVYNHFNRHGVEQVTDPWGMIPKYRPEFNGAAGMPLWAMDVYYHFLNCGFTLPVSGGSASGVKPSPLGYERVYVKLDGPLTYQKWFDALKSGRSFATNGPMLFFNVNGRELGDTLQLPAGGPARVTLHAETVSPRPLDRLEVIFNGKVIKTVRQTQQSSGLATPLTLDFETDLKESGWFAARCFETPDQTVRFAHTSPIYVRLGNRSALVREDAQFFIDWMDREIAFYERESGFRSEADRQAMLDLFRRARKIYANLK